MIEALNATVEFLNSYSIWAKILMVAGFSIFVLTAIFAPRNKKNDAGKESNNFIELINNTAKGEEFKAKILLNKALVPDYLKAKTEYDALNYTYNLKIDDETVDLVLFYHFNQQTQAAQYLILTKFYDINTKNIDWHKLDNDWKRFSDSVNYNKIKHALANANGFNSPIEFPNPMGSENFRPKILFTQICGRRKGTNALNATDLANMQKINTGIKTEIYRLTITYDFMLSGFNGLM